MMLTCSSDGPDVDRLGPRDGVKSVTREGDASARILDTSPGERRIEVVASVTIVRRQHKAAERSEGDRLAHRLQKTVPVSTSSTKASKAARSLVQMLAVNP